MPLARDAWSLNPRRTALIVTDVQNDYTHPEAAWEGIWAKIVGCGGYQALERADRVCKKRGVVGYNRAQAGDNEREG